MPTIDFYLIPETTNNQMLRFACRLLEKAYTQQRNAYVYVETQAIAQSMYDLLWTFRDISFVPHELAGGANAAHAPVLIGTGENPAEKHDVLLNLHQDIPEFYHHYDRIIEIVYQDEAWQKIARQHYKFYQQQELEIKTNDLRA